MYKEKQFNKLIKQICEENNIQFQELSDDWVKIVKDIYEKAVKMMFKKAE